MILYRWEAIFSSAHAECAYDAYWKRRLLGMCFPCILLLGKFGDHNALYLWVHSWLITLRIYYHYLKNKAYKGKWNFANRWQHTHWEVWISRNLDVKRMPMLISNWAIVAATERWKGQGKWWQPPISELGLLGMNLIPLLFASTCRLAGHYWMYQCLSRRCLLLGMRSRRQLFN